MSVFSVTIVASFISLCNEAIVNCLIDLHHYYAECVIFILINLLPQIQQIKLNPRLFPVTVTSVMSFTHSNLESCFFWQSRCRYNGNSRLESHDSIPSSLSSRGVSRSGFGPVHTIRPASKTAKTVLTSVLTDCLKTKRMRRQKQPFFPSVFTRPSPLPETRWRSSFNPKKWTSP